MAEDHLKRSASFRSAHRDEPSFEEDPLIELARIVAEDGGFRRHRTPELRPARNEPGRHQSPLQEEAIASQLEAELLQEWEALARDADVAPRRPVTEVRARGDAGQAQPAQVSPRPAITAEHRQPPRFPEIVIEDARATSGDSPERHGDWREHRRAPREEAPEPFEEELHALFSDSGPSRAVEAGLGQDVDGSGMALSGYEESYGESYAAEIEEGEEFREAEPEADDYFAEEEARELAAARPELARRGRSYKGLIAAVGVLGVVILGGAVTALVGGAGPSTDSGPPPVIRAEAGPVKVEPEETAEAQMGDGAGQAVYDRVAGRAPKSDEKLVDRAEEPRQVSRVVLPQTADGSQAESASGTGAGEEPDAELARSLVESAQSQEEIAGSISSETARTKGGPRIDPVGPRRVRTLTIRPDGSIASPPPVQVAQAAPEPQGQVEVDFETPNPVRVRTVRIEDEGERPSRALQTDSAESRSEAAAAPQPFAPVADSARTEAPAPEAPGGASGAGAAGAEEATDTAALPESQIAMLPRARPDEIPAAFLQARSPEPEEAVSRPAAAARTGQPVDLLAAAPAAPRAHVQQAQPRQQAVPPPAASSPFAVQLSAQRSEDQARATFANLRNRFPSILGGHEAQIERADLGDRGIYYRVRVGARSQAEAAQLCEQLKSAGGNCFVTR